MKYVTGISPGFEKCKKKSYIAEKLFLKRLPMTASALKYVIGNTVSALEAILLL